MTAAQGVEQMSESDVLSKECESSKSTNPRDHPDPSKWLALTHRLPVAIQAVTDSRIDMEGRPRIENIIVVTVNKHELQETEVRESQRLTHALNHWPLTAPTIQHCSSASWDLHHLANGRAGCSRTK